MKRGRRKMRSLAGLLALVLCLSAICPAGVSAASLRKADGTEAAYYYEADGTKTYASSAEEAWAAAKRLGTGMGILRDWFCGRLTVEKGVTVYLELNGHMVSRGLTEAVSNGEVISLAERSNLTIYGGTKLHPEEGSGTEHRAAVYAADYEGAVPGMENYTGGLVTGGYNKNRAGGIEVSKGAVLTLSHVTVAGNRAERSFARGGYGGGIRLSGDYAKLELDHAAVYGNYAAKSGGGICVESGADRCSVRMTQSAVTDNLCGDGGAGIALLGRNAEIAGDAELPDRSGTGAGANAWDGSCTGSVIANNEVLSNGDGGGIYIGKSGATVSRVNVVTNRTRGGDGGGVFVDADHTVLTGCVIIGNRADSARRTFRTAGGNGGGVCVNDDLTTVRNCIVRQNVSAVAGGGIYVANTVDLILGGSCNVTGNFVAQAGAAERSENVFLGAGAVQDAYLVADHLNADSAVGLTLGKKHGDKVVCGNAVSFAKTNRGATVDQRIFRSDDGTKYYYWNSETNPRYDTGVPIAKGRSSYDYRWVIALPAASMPEGYAQSLDGTPGGAGTPVTGGVTEVGTCEAGGRSYPLWKGTAGIPSSADMTRDVAMTYYYSDAWFLGNPAEYNEHLATLSAVLSMAAGASNLRGSRDEESKGLSYLVRSQNIVRMLRDIGVAEEDIYTNEFNKTKPDVDSMGVTVGSKRIGGKTLVIIGPRGSGYEAEWAGNFRVGVSGEAAGFRAAAEIVTEELATYMAEHGIDGDSADTVFWIAGYSRGGATANLAAKRIVDTYKDAGKRTFAYTFEAAMGGVASEEKGDYSCIHNIVNPADPVVYVAPAEMGLKRYGTDRIIGGSASDGEAYEARRAAMLLQLYAIDNTLVYDDYFHAATVSLAENAVLGSNVNSLVGEISNDRWEDGAEFLPALFADICECGFNYAPDGTEKTGDYRRFYASEIVCGDMTFEQAVGVLLQILYSLDREQLTELLTILKSLPDRLGTDLLAGTYLLIPDERWYTYDSYDEIGRGIPGMMLDRLWEIMCRSDERKGFASLTDVLSKEQTEALHGAWKSLIFPLLYWAKTDYDRSGERLQMLGTLLYNAETLIMNHYPEVTIAYLRSADSYYTGVGK